MKFNKPRLRSIDPALIAPLKLLNNSTITFLSFAFIVLMIGHVGSFLYNCVYFYRPGHGTCQNHRPPSVPLEKRNVEITVVARKDQPNPRVLQYKAAESLEHISTQDYIQLGKITVDSNIRFGPGIGYPVLGTLNEGSEIEILETKDDWHKVRRIDSEEIGDDLVGWVWRNLVSD